MADPRQKALDLIELALDEATTEEEGRSAAVKAVKLIDKHDLLASTGSENDTVRAVSTAVGTVMEAINSVKNTADQFTRRGDSGDGGRRRRRRRR